ncbi:MAG: hypothetical protein QOK10_2548 [Pseudonocardiales bacterium]|jgi:hypothetical protein|nr:hypothetical protein [Pseudonocardiales bacterium]
MTAKPPPIRIDLEPEQLSAGLAQVIVAVLRLLHELLERQAIRRFEEGNLSAEQVERLGTTLQAARTQLDTLTETLLETTRTAGQPTVRSPVQGYQPLTGRKSA